MGQVLVEKMVRAHGNLVLQEHWDDADNVLPWEQDMTISAADCRDSTTTQGDKVDEEEDDEDEDSFDYSSSDSDSSSEEEDEDDDANLGDRQRERKRRRLAALPASE